MVKVRLKKVGVSEIGCFMLLESIDDSRLLPIFIGPSEAQALQSQAENDGVPRPMTHQLMRNIMDELGASIRGVRIVKLEEHTFHATLELERGGGNLCIDARPSDAVALALGAGAPIHVAAAVMNAAAVRPEDILQHDREHPEAEEDGEREESKVGTLEHAMARAVAEERYEDAARLRDVIEDQRPAEKKG
ncbi:MAG: bifunctional nuclease family protein [Lentisphaeria bacterium]|nr:bifunctional nuclease family protein [Lentisphaeria bacterium]